MVSSGSSRNGNLRAVRNGDRDSKLGSTQEEGKERGEPQESTEKEEFPA
jgi:hypothetical protein